MTRHITHRQYESGSVLTMLLAGIALAGLLSFTVYGILNGPVRSAATVTMKTKAQSEMILAARLLTRAATDTNGDDVVEAPEFDPGATPKPTGGGGIPLSVGASKKDPWGMPYGYCVWDHGTPVGGNRLAGVTTGYETKILIAVISAGPNRVFNTTCAGDPTYITSDDPSDDIVERYTFEQIEAMGSELWKKVDPNNANSMIQYESNSVLIGNVASPSAAALQVAGDTEVTSGGLSVSGNITAGGLNGVVGNLVPAAGSFTNLVGNGTIALNGTMTIDGTGSINGLAIGGSSPSTGSFTALNADTGAFGPVTATTIAADSAVFTGTIEVGVTTHVANLNADLLDGEDGADFHDATQLTGTLDPDRLPAFTGDVSLTRTNATTVAASVVRLNGNPMTNDAPGANTVLGWDGAAWKPMLLELGSGTPGNTVGIGGVNYLATDTNITQANCPAGYVPQSLGASWSCVDAAGLGGGGSLTLPINVDNVPASGRVMELSGTNKVFLGFRGTNTYMGKEAGTAIDGGQNPNYVTAIGNLAGRDNRASYNTFIGNAAGRVNTTGQTNTFVGNASGYNNLSGGENTFIGNEAGAAVTTKGASVMIGYKTGGDQEFSVVIGNTAGYQSSGASAGYNIFIGTAAGRWNGNTGRNVHIGHEAGYNYTVTGNTMIGYQSGKVDGGMPGDGSGTSLVFLGYQTGWKNTTGSRNTFLGYEAGKNNTTGNSNTLVGNVAGTALTTGCCNTLLGSQAGMALTTGVGNVVIGYAAGDAMTTHGGSVIIGNEAGTVLTASNSTFIGNYAGWKNTTGYYNLFVGNDAGRNNVTGAQNTYVGSNAGASATGDNNALFGFRAGFSQTTASSNAFFGAYAGDAVTTGSGNTFLGTEAGYKLTIGGGNTFVGASAGYNTTLADGNTFVGHQAGSSNTTGANNVFVGKQTGTTNTSGGDNTFLGFTAGYANTTGGGNTFVGRNTGAGNTTASNNTFIGQNAGMTNTTGTENVYIGNDAGRANNFNRNVAIGYMSARTLPSGSWQNTFVGWKAGEQASTNGGVMLGSYAGCKVIQSFMVVIGDGAASGDCYSGGPVATGGFGSVVIGNNAGNYIRGADDSVIIGKNAAYNAEDADFNVVIGTEAGYNLNGLDSAGQYTKGDLNTLMGYRAGFSATTPINTVVIGNQAGLYMTTASRSTLVGAMAGQASNANKMVGTDNTYLGYQAGFSSSAGFNNVFIGSGAAQLNTTGTNNVFIGFQAGYNNTVGNEITLVGRSAGFAGAGDQSTLVGTMAGFNSTGARNTFIGHNAGVNTTTGTRNTFIGMAVGVSNTTGSNNVFIGNQFDGSSATVENEFRVGTPAAGIFMQGNMMTGPLEVKGGTATLSDARLKHDVKTIEDALEKVGLLRGVTYHWNKDAHQGPSEKTQIGFIAQEVEKVVPEVVNPSSDGFFNVSYDKLVPVLVEAVKELHAKIIDIIADITGLKDALKAEQEKNAKQQAEIDALSERLMKLEKAGSQ